MFYSQVIATGGYLPQQVRSNMDIAQMVDTSDEWIQQRVGIAQRHIASDQETSSYMAEQAARQAIAHAGIEAADISMIIVGTSTPENYFPSTACLLQQKLAINNQSMAFDVSAACSGFVYALTVAEKFIAAGDCEYALVVGVDALARLVDWSDRSTCVLFGDGAGACILKRSKQPGILASSLHSRGEYHSHLYVPTPIWDDQKKSHIIMKGNETFRIAVSKLSETIKEIIKKAGVRIEEIDWFIPHQANLRIIQATVKRLGLSMDKVVMTIQDHGNTSAASVPLAFHEAISDGRIQPGQLILLEAFGGGFTWGSVLLRY